jgi:small-conductance mechanosensitive channel
MSAHLGNPLAGDPAATVFALSDSAQRWVYALVCVLVAIVLAYVIDRLLSRRGAALAEAVARGDLSPETDTRLRFLRRLLFATIILIGLALALAQFDGINKLAASLLASGAIAAAILGFAARQTLANFVAGIMIAVTQPIRLGDWVFIEDQYGVVEDIRLNYTFLRTLAGQRVVIPNEKLASGILRNDTLIDGVVGLEVDIWIPPGADVRRAVDLLTDATEQVATVAESRFDGIRIHVGGERCAPPERAAREAALRLQCLDRLRAEGLLRPPE